MDKIGVITITYNSGDVLDAFLNCIRYQTYKNFTLYVIDNCSSDNTLKILSYYQNATIIRNDFNVGVAKANNQGIKRAIEDSCDRIMLINNDVEFEPDLFDKLLKCQKSENCSLVVPKMMYYTNPKMIWYAGSKFIKKKGYLPIHFGIGELDNGQYDKVMQVEYAPTCCLLINSTVFEDVGLMDEEYFVYFDDTDFSYRIFRDERHKIIYYPHIKFYHKVGSLTNSFDEKMYRGNFFISQNVKNHIYFLKKIGSLHSILFIIWLFFKNNLVFVVNPRIKKNISTWWLINKSYFEGILK